MNRSDERKQIHGAHHAGHHESNHGAHGFDAEEQADAKGGGERIGLKAGGHVGSEHVSHEHDDKISHSDQGGKAGEGSSMSGVGGARSAQSRKQADDREEQLGEHKGGVRGGRGITHESVDADHVIGDGGAVGTHSAEGMSDMASSKANRKEAMEPEREENEKAAMGRERTVPTKNTMGHGERETVGRHTI